MVRAFRALTFLLTVALAAACTVKDTPAPPLAGPSALLPSIVPTFTVSPSTPAEGTAVVFDASASSGTGAIVSYTWNFDDGGSDSGKTATHRFGVAGTYNVTLTVADSSGKTGSAAVPVKVVPGTVPTAAFDVSPSTINVNDPVFFNAMASTGGAGRTIVSYKWLFGDGTDGTGVSVTHSYSIKNGYSVTLQVTNDAGLTATLTKQVTVGTTTPPAAPIANFIVTPVQPIARGNPVGFDGSGSTATAPAIILSYAWDFGDGTSATGPVAAHTYSNTAPAGFVVILTVTDSNGQIGRRAQVVSIQ
jgi:PKD repeat protein